ncbi:Ferric/cupric reductase transmembrane component 2 [Ceratocystis lukuohia]|uniref:Ferric/cupric reductase transmembrane component 2 n=2 Tax=Ceratocystis TaxID=5157 RepID=A0A0F8DL83_CERFI|nr:Ferric/cupric reductase transmembrane component 2 [Ceratocystis platani]
MVSFSDVIAGISPTIKARAHGTYPADASSTIAPYHSGLNGVNQPMNLLFVDVLWWTLGIIGLIIFAVRISEITWMHIRQVTAMTSRPEQQNYWKYTQNTWLPSLKQHLLYAPLWDKRHNREFRLSKAGNMGTLPSRLHSLFLAIYILSNIAYMFVLDWANPNEYAVHAELRGRSGTLAMVNMVPLMLLATRNNPLIGLLKISFDTYNLFHRWLGRLCVIEILIHTGAWLYVQTSDGGWSSVGHRFSNELFISSGFIGMFCMVILLITSFSPIRHAFYETFLTCHIFFGGITFAMTLTHCLSAEIGHLPQTSWTVGIICMWFLERLARVCRLAYCNYSGRGYTEAVIEAMPGDATRVTMHLPRYVNVKPGTHAYIRFRDISPFENHPFSIAWVDHHEDNEDLPPAEKHTIVTRANRKHMTTSVSFIIGAQTGFTRQLYNYAATGGSQPRNLAAAFEGPYAGHHSLDSYGHAVLFAGSTGITHQISYLRPVIEGYNNGTVATRRLTLVWIVRDYDALEWIRPWMDTVLRMPNRKDILRIQLFITRPKNPREIVSASSTVQMFPGRPNVPMILHKEVQEQVGSMVVTVCGAGALADDVRMGVRQMQDEGTVVDFVEESFTW